MTPDVRNPWVADPSRKADVPRSMLSRAGRMICVALMGAALVACGGKGKKGGTTPKEGGGDATGMKDGGEPGDPGGGGTGESPGDPGDGSGTGTGTGTDPET